MKKTLFIVAMVAIMICGCTKNENLTCTDSKFATLTCTLPASDTKMSVAADGKVTWFENDSIVVYNNASPGVEKIYHLIAGAGTATGTFQGEAFESGKARIAFYPVSCKGSFQPSSYGTPKDKLQMLIPTSLQMTSAGADQNVPAIMAAYINDGATAINFEHVATLLKLSFTNIPSNAREIKISQTSTLDKKKWGINGDRFFTVTNMKGYDPTKGVTNVGGATKDGTGLDMSLLFPNNAAITSGEGTFYFPITVYNAGATRTFTMNFLDGSGNPIANTERAITSDKFLAGNMIVFPTVPAIAGTVAVESVSLDTTAVTIAPGEKYTLTATVLPADATDKSVTWSSSEEGVATVSDGVVTAVAVGSTTITVTTTDGGKTATCTVTVEAESKIIADWDLNSDLTKTQASFGETTGSFQTTFPGDNGKNVAATTGTGSITYYANSSRTADASNFARLVGGNGDPYTQGCLPGDYWLIDATASKTIPAGTTLSIYFVTKCGTATSSYWMLEFKDGETWKPVKATSTKQESATQDINKVSVSYSAEITYNLCFTLLDSGKNGAYEAVDETFTTSVDMTNIQIRFRPVGQLGLNGSKYDGMYLNNIISKSNQQRFSAQRPSKSDGTAVKTYDQHVTIKIADK